MAYTKPPVELVVGDLKKKYVAVGVILFFFIVMIWSRFYKKESGQNEKEISGLQTLETEESGSRDRLVEERENSGKEVVEEVQKESGKEDIQNEIRKNETEQEKIELVVYCVKRNRKN